MKEKHQDCRTNILRIFEIRPVYSPIIKTLSAKPKVVKARFILIVTYVLYPGPLRGAANKDYHKLISSCPQHHLVSGTGPGNSFAAVLQKAAINAATVQDQHIESFSCKDCPTDYLVVAEDDDTLTLWSRFGMTKEMDSLLRIPASKVTFTRNKMECLVYCSLIVNIKYLKNVFQLLTMIPDAVNTNAQLGDAKTMSRSVPTGRLSLYSME